MVLECTRKSQCLQGQRKLVGLRVQVNKDDILSVIHASSCQRAAIYKEEDVFTSLIAVAAMSMAASQNQKKGPQQHS